MKFNEMAASRQNQQLINLLSFTGSILAVTAILFFGRRTTIPVLTGSLLLVTSCFMVFYLFLRNSFPELLRVTVKLIFLKGVIISFTLLTSLVDIYRPGLLPLIPFAIIPVVIWTFYDARLALFTLFMTLLISGFLVERPFEFVFTHFIAGVTAIFTLTNIHGRKKIFVTVAILVLIYSFLHLGFGFMEAGKPDLSQKNIFYYICNGTLVLLSYPLIFLFENKFQFLSDATLLELSDTNQQLLRKLAVEAPGSFQHSMQVANLAEEAARVTGANPLLARAGALYHDIGKIDNPSFYSENQKNGINPHENISPEESARLIINHVSNGIILAKNFKVPEQIIDFIRMHHGTTIAYYFFRKYSDMKPWETGREKDFAYPGPKPGTRETAIVMMADAVEASSRSLDKPSDENISELVERIILLQEQDGQYSEIPFTYRDISEIKEAFKKRLSTIYHGRIAYPDRE